MERGGQAEPLPVICATEAPRTTSKAQLPPGKASAADPHHSEQL